MGSTTRASERPTFASRCSLSVVDLTRSSTASSPNGADALFRSVLRGERGRRLRAGLAAQHRGRSPEEIEEAIQIACRRFVDRAEEISAPGQVYVWIRTTAHRQLNRKVPHRLHEVPLDPSAETLQSLASTELSPEEEAIAQEKEAELGTLVEEALASLPEIQRDILALYIEGCGRPEICSRLDLPDHTVKRELRFALAGARTALAERVGGGCERGEQLVLRFVCGLASTAEASQARLHVGHCRRCELFSERLSVWREKVGALLPLPAAAEGASPGVIARLAHRTADAVSSFKRQVVDGGGQLKQHAASAYSRAVDPTPLAGARPGAVAAVIAGCVTIGSGATYCAQHGVDPLGAATGLIAGTQEAKRPAPPPEPEEPASMIPPPVSEEAPSTEATESAPPVEAEHSPPPEPPPQPPPEQSFEPASPGYVETSEASESAGSESAPAESARPAPVSGSAPQFGGP
jgi:RNA polymerase sigma factor (sigma-70 family)